MKDVQKSGLLYPEPANLQLSQLPASDGLLLSVAYFPVVHAKGVIQLIHGAREHKERYYGFIHYLNEKGYSCVIADNRGHGASINETYFLGNMDGFRRMVEDSFEVSLFAKRKCPDIPLVLFGHSYGSMLARIYLEDHEKMIKGLILTGTVCYWPASKTGIRLGEKIMARDSRTADSPLLGRLANGKNYNWVNSDPSVIKMIKEDPLFSGYKYTNASMYTILECDAELHRFSNFPCRNPLLPILSLTGALDPCTGGPAGLADTRRGLKKVGYLHFRSLVYPHLKHEIFNCRGNEKVLADLISFLDKVTAVPSLKKNSEAKKHD